MSLSRLLAAVLLVAPSLALAQATVPEAALSGPAFSLQPKAAPTGRNAAPVPAAPGGPPGTAGARIPKPPMSEARAADPILTAYVRSLQEQLPAHGYRPGPATGRLDPQTERAIRAYQRDAGIAPNARSTWVLKQTIDSVSFARPPIQAAGAGGGGGTIAYVQQRLSAKGYDPGPADGRLGRRTTTAIEDFQGDRGMPRDGKVTPQLLDLLHRN